MVPLEKLGVTLTSWVSAAAPGFPNNSEKPANERAQAQRQLFLRDTIRTPFRATKENLDESEDRRQAKTYTPFLTPEITIP